MKAAIQEENTTDSIFCKVQKEPRLNNGGNTFNLTEYKARAVVSSGEAGRAYTGPLRFGRVVFLNTTEPWVYSYSFYYSFKCM